MSGPTPASAPAASPLPPAAPSAPTDSPAVAPAVPVDAPTPLNDSSTPDASSVAPISPAVTATPAVPVSPAVTAAPAVPVSPAVTSTPAAPVSPAAGRDGAGVAGARLPQVRASSSGPAPTRITRPADALAELIAGNRRFVSGRPEHGHDVSAAATASGGQLPHAVVVGCIDSRVPLEAIFDQTFGSICVIRSGGHVVDRAVLGSVGFAVSALKVPLIMVLGHVRCGAVDATVSALRTGSRPDGDVGYLVDEIAPAVRGVGLDDPDVTAKAMRAHVARTVRRLRDVTGVPELVAAGSVSIAGAVYDLDTGWVDLLT
ncbi:carbonic anhydrase [Actinoplanes sp. NPDC051346]|uniref:carbonic anhydrase n=1 Tax=Actinoplanes sp. NPDC051346 TaxID=3155048 RepID=UPI003443987B